VDKVVAAELFGSFFKIGGFAFGGGYAMVPLIQREVVDRHRWLTAEEFLDALCVAQSSPGPIAVNLASYIGYRVAGPAGLLAAAVGAILPSFAVTLLVVALIYRFAGHPVVTRFFAGVRPAVLALIAVAAWDLARAALSDKRGWLLAGAAALLVSLLHVHPGWVLAGGVAAGLVLFGEGSCPLPPPASGEEAAGSQAGEEDKP
jgi:chromate transporter